MELLIKGIPVPEGANAESSFFRIPISTWELENCVRY